MSCSEPALTLERTKVDDGFDEGIHDGITEVYRLLMDRNFVWMEAPRELGDISLFREEKARVQKLSIHGKVFDGDVW